MYSTNVCSDEIRNAFDLSSFEMNQSVSSRKFVNHLIDNEYQFDQIYVDHYRMAGAYVAKSFSKRFFINMKWIARMCVFKEECKTSSGRGEIYLPFFPHFLSMLSAII